MEMVAISFLSCLDSESRSDKIVAKRVLESLINRLQMAKAIFLDDLVCIHVSG